jgi:hypothetical protein
MAHKIRVISPVAGFGNALDLEIVTSLLEQSGFDVTSYPVQKRGKTERSTQVLKRVMSMRGRFDVNIFLAPIFPECLPMARKNLLVPNAEGFAEHLHKWLPQIDLVLAKMSCRAVTFSTNAPPMNEMVLPSRGVQVECLSETSKLALTRGYFFNPESLETEIERALKLDQKTIGRVGTAARQFYIENDQFFRRNFIELIRSL